MNISSASSLDVVSLLRQTYSSRITFSLSWRKNQLKKLADLLKNHESEISDALFADLRKSKFESYTAEIAQVKTEITYYQKNLARWCTAKTVKTPLVLQPAESVIMYEPLGVVCIISPWNYPISLALRPLTAAITAGNCAIIKPSEYAPNCAKILNKLIPQYLDPSAFKVFCGGPEVVKDLLANRFDHIFFTGSTHLGKTILQYAAEHLTPVTLELGGKSPCIVDKDTPLKVVAKRIAWGKWMNAGQSCVAPDYILVDSTVKAELIAELILAVTRMFGEDPELSTDYGRIVNQNHLRRLQQLLVGERVVYGGATNKETLYFAPTIVDSPGEYSALMEEEIFGPILPIIEINSIQDVVAKLASKVKPLALYLFSNNQINQKIILESTSSGNVCINDTMCQLAVPELPFGGVGHSGMGSYHGKAGFETFSHKKSVLKRSFRFDIPLRYPPYSNTQIHLAKLFI